MDDVDRHIITVLQNDARTPFAELGRRVGLTAPAVADRIRKLEGDGVLLGYHASVNAHKLGKELVAFVRVSAPAGDSANLTAIAKESVDVLEFHRVAGGESFVAKVAVDSLSSLETLIARFELHGRTVTSIVLSSPVDWKEVAV